MKTQSHALLLPESELDTVKCQQKVVRNPLDGVRRPLFTRGTIRLDLMF